MNRKFISLFLFLLVAPILKARELDNGNEFFSKNITSVEFLRGGQQFLQPIISLKNGEKIHVYFDELFSSEVKNYAFSVMLCDSEWNPASIPKNEYLSNFLEDYIEEYEPSGTSGLPYVSYSFRFPNENLQIRKSGNYILYIMEDSDTEKIILKKRFYVSENIAKIEAEMAINERATYRSGKQNINLSIDLENLNNVNFRNDIQVIIKQNGRSDNAIFFPKPDFIHGKVLRYESLNTDRSFEGGIEYQALDLTSSNFNSSSGHSRLNEDGIYEFLVTPHIIRISGNYSFLNDINGEKVIENLANLEKHQLPYAKVKFTIFAQKEFQTGEIFLIGSLVNWHQSPQSQFMFHPETKNYELSLFLKQGYYDYQFGFRRYGEKEASMTLLSGSSFETENNYHLFVYLKNRFPKYDRLIGYKKINTRKK